MKDLHYAAVHYTANKIRYEEQNDTLQGACNNLITKMAEQFK